jgi:hypothetical protein
MDAIRAKPTLKSSSASAATTTTATTTNAPSRQMSMIEELANSLGRRRSAIVASGDVDVREKIREKSSGGVVGLGEFLARGGAAAGDGGGDDDDDTFSDESWDDD